jgi:hypothetical protein
MIDALGHGRRFPHARKKAENQRNNPLSNALHDLADVTMSMLMRDLVKEALELREDRALAELAAERDRRRALPHDEIWD